MLRDHLTQDSEVMAQGLTVVEFSRTLKSSRSPAPATSPVNSVCGLLVGSWCLCLLLLSLRDVEWLTQGHRQERTYLTLESNPLLASLPDRCRGDVRIGR